MFAKRRQSDVVTGRRVSKIRSAVAGISLTVCIAAAVLWVRSTTEMDQVRNADALRQTTFVSANGEICLQVVTVMLPSFETGTSVAHAMPSQYRPSLIWEAAGFGRGHTSFPTLDGPIVSDTYMVPLWLVVVLFAIPPVLIWDGRRLLGAEPTVSEAPTCPASSSPASPSIRQSHALAS